MRRVGNALATGLLLLGAGGCVSHEQPSQGTYVEPCGEGVIPYEVGVYAVYRATGQAVDPAQEAKIFTDAADELRRNPKVAQVLGTVTIVFPDNPTAEQFDQAGRVATAVTARLKAAAGDQADRFSSFAVDRSSMASRDGVSQTDVTAAITPNTYASVVSENICAKYMGTPSPQPQPSAD